MTAATTREERWRLGYRPELDGVRGLAIGLVLFGHLVMSGEIGGLAGVTLFFVLSGYLITALLVAEHRQTGSISLRQFYARRVRRLLPALVLTVSAVTAVQFAIGAPNSGWAGLGALSYVANWLLIGGADLVPLAHSWSLAVEEHFYLLWPALLILLVGRRWVIPGLLVAAAVSLTLRAWFMLHGASVERIAYGTDARADALLIGCALALIGHRLPFVSVWIGIPLLLAASWVARWNEFGLTVGLLAVAVTGAIVIRAGAERSSWLGWWPLARLGRISYGVYLYHVPLWYAAYGLAQPWRSALVLVASIALAEVSYRWIEEPILRWKGRRPQLSATRLDRAHPR